MPAQMAESFINPKFSRKLAAILAADIVGYSALMGRDEARTVRDLKAHQTVILPMIAEHVGRIIDTAGDGILAEFASVVNAVECGVAIQKTMAERNATVDPARRMQFRIGINLGDVIHDDTRVYGDGVNVAARLESIAEPGGICLSGEAFAQVQRRLSLNAVDLGDQQLKNIEQPVRVYRVDCGPVPTASQARPALSLPDKPSVAILPFTNLSGDKEQEYFSDGITEDIITELSRFSELFVIARNSSFQYKGKFPDIRQVGRELGVRYVLEGSIRRASDRVRISAQLIDATNGVHRWADRYDRKVEDVFAVHDEVARTIVTILVAHVNKAEVERTLLKPPAAWQAHDYYLRAADTLAQFRSSFKVEDLDEARRLIERSLSFDSNYARAHALLADTYTNAYTQPVDAGYLNVATLDCAYQAACKALQLDPNLPIAHAQLGYVLVFKKQHDASIKEFEKAGVLNPNYTDWRFGLALGFSGEFTRAIAVLQAHMRLDPFYPPPAIMWLGIAHYELKQYSEAVPYFLECVLRAPNYRAGHLWSAANSAQLGHFEEAQKAAAEAMRLNPNFTIEGTGRRLAASCRHQKDAEHFFDGLRKAGLPE